MFCTHCGAGEQSNKAYCKRCGKWLGASPPEKQLIVMLVFNLLSALFGAASALALFASYLGTTAAKPAVYVAATFCIIISVYQTISFFFTLSLMLRGKKARTDTQQVKELKRPGYSPSLEAAKTGGLVDIPSVTENTTSLLEPVARRPVRSD
jgi:hypothetical protein